MSRALAPNTWKDVIINVDLHTPAFIYLDKLDAWKDLAKSAAEGQSLSRLVDRYEQLWLPLLASWSPDDDIEPPNDIHWIWHLHMLRTTSYSSYCMQRFGRVLPHRLRSLRPVQMASVVQQTESVWRQHYPGELFDLSAGDVWVTVTDDSDERASSHLVDVLTDIARRDVDFSYQVALPHYRDDNFLYAAAERYRKLLLMRRLRTSEFSVTSLPVDILLMMRVHALHPTQFNGDVQRLFGDSPAAMELDWASLEYDALPPAALYQLNNIWQRKFGRGQSLFVDGSGLRGRRAGAVNCGDDTTMRQLPPDVLPRDGVDSCHVTFMSLTVDDVWSRSAVKRISIEARLLGHSSVAREILFRASGSIGASISRGRGGAALGSTHFSVSQNRGIELAVFRHRGLRLLCFGRRRYLTSKTFNPIQQCFVNGVKAGALTTVVLPKVTYTDPRIAVTFHVQATATKPLVFTLDRSDASVRPITTSLRRFVGSMRRWADVIGSADSLFQHAKHGLKCRDGGLGFDVEVIRHEHSDLAGIILYLNNEHIIAAAYSIDNDQLPQPAQVSEVCPVSFDGSHAMLIRNHDGDFAVCAANLLHYSTFGGEIGSSRLQYRVYFINSRQLCTFEVREDEMQTITMKTSDGCVQVDLPTGRLTVNASVRSLTEYLTLTFAIGVIFITMRKPLYMLV